MAVPPDQLFRVWFVVGKYLLRCGNTKQYFETCGQNYEKWLLKQAGGVCGL